MEHRGRTTREKGYHAEEEGSCSGVGETKGKGSGGLRKDLGLGHRGQADEDQAARDLYFGERRNLPRENGWLSLCGCRADSISLLFSPSNAVVELSGRISHHLEDL